ncbi:MAG: L-seryl-tRNA(Sec) selenium transferase [Actinomycetota bacterium]
MPNLSPDEARTIPQVDLIIRNLDTGAPHLLKAIAARSAIEVVRLGQRPVDEVIELARQHLRRLQSPSVAPVINATGVLLHTNLGRAPLSDSAVRAVSEVAANYSNLEFDLQTGKRGSRYKHAIPQLCALTGAEDCLIVNNNAAAVLLTLNSLAKNKEVIVSRGELVEIGGEFRIPDVMAASGAIMREVGTTNRTHLKDYENAIGPNTAAIMKVHPSNYRVVGFTASVSSADAATLANKHGLSFIHDLGSGLVGHEFPDEASVASAVAENADLVTFSADKLLGGPQAGIIAGKRTAIAELHRSPMLRALRVDKMTLAALEATLREYIEDRPHAVPLWKMANLSPADIEQRAVKIVDALGETSAKVVLCDGYSTTGGGSAPTSRIPTVLIEVTHRIKSADNIIRALLDNEPPIVARIENDRVLLDLRTVFDAQDTHVEDALKRLL